MSAQNTQTDKIRLQFDFSPEAHRDLEQIQKDLGAPSKAETVRYALRTLQWLITMADEGASFLIQRKEQAPREVIFPFLATSQESSTNKERAGQASSSARRRQQNVEALQH